MVLETRIVRVFEKYINLKRSGFLQKGMTDLIFLLCDLILYIYLEKLLYLLINKLVELKIRIYKNKKT